MKVTIEFPVAETLRVVFWSAMVALMFVVPAPSRAEGLVEAAIAEKCVEYMTTRKSLAGVLYDCVLMAVMLCFAAIHLARVGP